MQDDAVIRVQSLDFHWPTRDPFLFCAYHNDHYPPGNSDMGPQASLQGRDIGMDFTLKDGWRMYHGDRVPGFPAHPHRGFETVTVVSKGMVDHADSMGAAGRYGGGDVQWMTAGRGVQHSEMFPLLDDQQGNDLELFQIWLNLPRIGKMVDPHFTMFWREAIPVVTQQDSAGRTIRVDIIAGSLGGSEPLSPPPDSWAADADNHVSIWIIRLAAGAVWTLPAAVNGLNRTLYFHRGADMQVAGVGVAPMHAVELLSDRDVLLANGAATGYLLLLQGRPINEPVAHHGPFVMNSRAELQQAFLDYQQTQFGGWSWPRHDQTHGRGRGRFARYADGREEVRES